MNRSGEWLTVPEPPSPQLQELLSRLHLCSPLVLRRCRWRVKRLARDLPAFDSVWLDALVQARLLTTYQAGVLASRTPDRLNLGQWVLQDKLGGGAWSETFSARSHSGKQRCALKRLVVPSDTRPGVLQRLQQLAGVADELRHSAVVWPRTVGEMNGELVAASRLIEGVTLRDLLVRRGRFPARVVDEIGCALSEGLEAIHRQQLVHGDVGLDNVRLTRRGEVVLVDAGIKPALEPRFVIDTTRTPDSFDGVAPERIESGGPATEASDAYALGCLLWELLAGRPPFPSGDPLAKLTAHQHGHIVDVRDWAPSTPGPLAERIASWCARDPGQRQLVGEPGSRWKTKGSGSSNRSLAGFLARFRTAAPARPAETRNGRVSNWSVGVTLGLLVFLGGLAYATEFLSESPRREFLLRLGGERQRQSPRLKEPSGELVSRGVNVREKTRHWPAWNAEGEIQLGDERVWPATRLRRSGRLVVSAVPGQRPVIDPRGRSSLELSADEIVLRGLTLRHSGSQPLVIARTHRLILQNCVFEGVEEVLTAGARATVEVVGDDARGVSVFLEQVTSHGDQHLLSLQSGGAANVAAENCLAVGGGSWLTWRPGEESHGSLRMQLKHVTLRRAGRLLELPVGVAKREVLIETVACVLALREGQALCRGSQQTGVSIRVVGQHTLVNPGTTVGEGDVLVEGLVSAAGRFRGPASSRPGDSVLSRLPDGVPHSDSTLPGVRPVKKR